MQPRPGSDVSEVSRSSINSRCLGVYDVRPKNDLHFGGPRRPLWSYSDNVEELETRESSAFLEWMDTVVRDWLDAAYFEQNLETWRQLWRVEERSDILILVADIRFPALHFVPGLYQYVTKELGKGMVLALNKCDLVSEDIVQAWKTYFELEFKSLAVALFSSFPDARLAPSEANSELLSKRERRMARSRLSAWGADQLLAAIDTLQLPPYKRAYLEQWRSLLDLSSTPDVSHVQEDGNFHSDHEIHVDSQKRDLNIKSNSQTPVPATVDQEYQQSEECASDDSDVSNKADEFEQEINNQGDNQDDPATFSMVTIGVIGHPNAGKSSLINGIFGRKVVSTSRTPGHTKHLQTMFLSSHVRLCDCPGLVFPGKVPRELQVLAGMFPIAQLREPYAVVKYLADRVPLVSILELETEVAKIERENNASFLESSGWTAWKICEAWAAKRGFRTAKAARLDVFRAANSILRLALDGRIVLATVPPGYSPSSDCSGDDGDSIHDTSTTLQLSSFSVQSKTLSHPRFDSENDSDNSQLSSESCNSSDSESDEEAVSTGGMFAILGRADD